MASTAITAGQCPGSRGSTDTKPGRHGIHKTQDKERHFPGSASGKESACNAGDMGLIPGSGRSPGEGSGNPLQYSCLGNLTEEPGGLQSMGSKKSWT